MVDRPKHSTHRVIINSGLVENGSVCSHDLVHVYQADIFLRVAMTVLPIAAVVSYLLDSIWQLTTSSTYAGLSSTVLHIFYYLQFYSFFTVQPSWIITVFNITYQIIIWIVRIGGDVVYLIDHKQAGDKFYTVILSVNIVQDTVFICWICAYKILQYEPLIKVEHKALFSVVSRLEVILAILVPIFSRKDNLVKRTVANISLFILYDFFAGYYRWFTVRLKWCLWLFVVFVTVSVCNEWLYFAKGHEFEICDKIGAAFEFLAECSCCLLIIWQFQMPSKTKKPNSVL
ncbi:unnamed protein product [Didymodactylos carnosus]|uniref:Uncharacterized protein n=1 Tax=Didymodactylos carnosus TaxID=1234261 RepID=A0A815F4T4_9BILA|nr:unnamed protein product [Didymodactylos carnosus]CAF1509297.1 unnamed protein product [Didymodactylos carnosus]CAF4166117.1 unnamed protein product [Didymodactylos carnosus]CAF4297345.1 unnamed protein product [Didymodactylos carnosus]